MNDKEFKEFRKKYDCNFTPRSTRELAKFLDKITKIKEKPTEEFLDLFVENTVKGLMACAKFFDHRFGHSGFSASFTDNRFIMVRRHYQHGFIIIDADKFLYPQYNPIQELIDYRKGIDKDLAKAARELIVEDDTRGRRAHPSVRAHWEKLGYSKK